jgi:hypothetical protein
MCVDACEFLRRTSRISLSFINVSLFSIAKRMDQSRLIISISKAGFQRMGVGGQLWHLILFSGQNLSVFLFFFFLGVGKPFLFIDWD